MGGKDNWSRVWNEDPDYLNKNGKQNKAIMRMVERLMEAKDSSVDLTNMVWSMDIATVTAADYVLEDDGFTFNDKLGVLATMNVRGWICDYILTFLY